MFGRTFVSIEVYPCADEHYAHSYFIVVDVYNSINPSPWVSHKEPFPKGNPDAPRQRNIHWVTDKEKRILGLKFHTLEETARDILADYEAHGWK